MPISPQCGKAQAKKNGRAPSDARPFRQLFPGREGAKIRR